MLMFVSDADERENGFFSDPGFFKANYFDQLHVPYVELFQIFNRSGKKSGLNRGTVIGKRMAFAAREKSEQSEHWVGQKSAHDISVCGGGIGAAECDVGDTRTKGQGQ